MATGEIVGKVDLFAEGLGYLEWGDLPWPGELREFLERLRSSASFRQVQLMPASRMEAGIIILIRVPHRHGVHSLPHVYRCCSVSGCPRSTSTMARVCVNPSQRERPA